MRISRRSWQFAVVAAVSLVGCSTSGHGPSHPEEEASATGPEDPPVQVHAIHYADLDAMIRRHVGKVVVVDFWMVHCPPCKAGFPYLVQLHEKYGTHGVVVISVNMDDPGNAALRDKALAFLNQKHARFTNLVLATGEV